MPIKPPTVRPTAPRHDKPDDLMPINGSQHIMRQADEHEERHHDDGGQGDMHKTIQHGEDRGNRPDQHCPRHNRDEGGEREDHHH